MTWSAYPGVAVPNPTLPVVRRELAYMVDAVLIFETDTKELTVRVEKEPVPVPGALLLILDTVSVDRVRKDVLILDMIIVEPVRVVTVRRDAFIVDIAMVEPVIVDNVRVVTVRAGVALRRSAR
jgi:hypothetical protein